MSYMFSTSFRSGGSRPTFIEQSSMKNLNLFSLGIEDRIHWLLECFIITLKKTSMLY